ncbi:MAG: hypothetical protein AAGJ79_14105 [Verrucomicrobiota bacterium]
MKLEIPDSDISTSNPSEAEVAKAIDSLRWNKMADSCVDMNRNDREFLQVTARPDGKCDLRIRLKEVESAKQTLDPISLTEARSKAKAYLDNDLQWHSTIAWNEVPIGKSNSPVQRLRKMIFP